LMKNYLFFTFLPVILFTCGKATSKNEMFSTGGALDTSGYQLVWSDEFNGTSVDITNWNFEIGGHGWGNHEQEYYQAANAIVSDGNLVITGKKEDVQSSHYTSSRMTTKG